MATIIDGTSGSSIAGDATITGNLVVTGSATIGGQPAGGNYALNKYTAPATWTKPAGLKAIKVTVVGAGGGGATIKAPAPTAWTANGGGSGGVVSAYIPASSIPGPVSVTAGTGGTAAPTTIPTATGSNVGTTGGSSSFGALVTSTGGGGGPATPAGPTAVAGVWSGGASGTGSSTVPTPQYVSYTPQDPYGSVLTFSAGVIGQALGLPTAAGFGLGGTTSPGNVPGVPGTGYGSGGSGARNGSAPFASGDGAPGIVIVEEFY